MLRAPSRTSGTCVNQPIHEIAYQSPGSRATTDNSADTLSIIRPSSIGILYRAPADRHSATSPPTAATMADSKNTVDRQTTTPFHLKLFYRQNSYHQLSDFPIPRPGDPNPPLPPHLEIYTWKSCTLRELSRLLASALPSQLPDPPVGTRLCFRLIYPDTRGATVDGRGGRYLSKDIGSVVIGEEISGGNGDNNNNAGDSGVPGPRRSSQTASDDADKTLADARFVIGDFVDCAILPPLEDGSVAPPVYGQRTGPNAVIGGGMRAFGPPRENGFGGRRGGPSRGSGNGIPSGDWKRGEKLPEGGGYGRRRGPY